MAQTPSAETVVIADGSTRQFFFEFPYLETADVFVTVDGVAVDYEWLASNTLLLAEVPEAGSTVRMYRSTPAARPKYEFQLGAPFLPRYIDENFTQGLYVLQEGLGDIRKTVLRMDSVEEQVENFEIESGYEFLGEYADGPWTLERYNQVVRREGEWYRIGRTATLPYTTHLDWELDAPNLIGVGDATVRAELEDFKAELGSTAAGAGSAILGRGVVAVDSIADLLALPENSRREDLRYLVKGYHAGSDAGGGVFYYSPSRTEENDGGAVLSGWVRVLGDEVTPEMFGAVGDGVADDTAAISAAAAVGAVLCEGLYKTTFTSIPPYAYGNGRMILASPTRTEWVDRNHNTDRHRVRPSGFSFVPNIKITCSGVGQAMHNIDLRQLFDADFSALFGNSEFWVDPVNGDDANSGSFLLPVKTIRAAYQKPSVGIIRLLPGVYTDRFYLTFSDNTTAGGTQARPVRIVGLGDVVFRAPGQQPAEMTWAVDSSLSPATWAATPEGSEVANQLVYKVGGEEIVIPYCSTGTELTAATLGWHQITSTGAIHVKLGGVDVSAVAGDLEIMYSRGVPIGISGATTYIENVTFRGDSQFDVRYDGEGNRGTLYHKDCRFEFLEGANIHTQGARIYSQNTVSRNAQNSDGFNYYDQHFPAAGGQPTEAVEIDCIAHSNGVPVGSLAAGAISVPCRTWDGTRNKQGSSGHANSIICRINGEYYNNFGQNIADTGAGSKTWMIGSNCKDVYAELWNVGAHGRGPGLWTEGAAFLDSVRSAGETLSFAFVNQSGISKHVNCSYSGFNADCTLISGSIAALDVDNPDA